MKSGSGPFSLTDDDYENTEFLNEVVENQEDGTCAHYFRRFHRNGNLYR